VQSKWQITALVHVHGLEGHAAGFAVWMKDFNISSNSYKTGMVTTASEF
jgi:hypothetical protein